MNWYRRNHIERIALGAITLRRRSNQRNWFCSATVGRTLEDTAGGQLLRLFARQDYMDHMENPELLLNEIFTLVELDFSGTEKLPVAHARHGLRFELNISAVSKSVLQELDGKNTIEKAIQAVSQKSGMEAKQIQHEVLGTLMDLLKLGMIPSASGIAHEDL